MKWHWHLFTADIKTILESRFGILEGMKEGDFMSEEEGYELKSWVNDLKGNRYEDEK